MENQERLQKPTRAPRLVRPHKSRSRQGRRNAAPIGDAPQTGGVVTLLSDAIVGGRGKILPTASQRVRLEARAVDDIQRSIDGVAGAVRISAEVRVHGHLPAIVITLTVARGCMG